MLSIAIRKIFLIELDLNFGERSLCTLKQKRLTRKCYFVMFCHADPASAGEASHLQIFRFFAIACLSADRLRMTRNYAFETASYKCENFLLLQ